jgi:hypothetical protein
LFSIPSFLEHDRVRVSKARSKQKENKMKEVTVSITSTVFALLVAITPASVERVQEYLPQIQVAAYTAMTVNHTFQIARNFKRSEQ